MTKIFKFGGASVKDASGVINMCEIIKNHHDGTGDLLVVVSAMGKTTEALEGVLNNYVNKKNFLPALEKIRKEHLAIVNQLFNDKKSPVFEAIESGFATMEGVFKKSDPSDEYDVLYDAIVGTGEIISSRIIYYYLKDNKFDCKWINSRKYIRTDNTWREAKPDWNWTEKLIRTDIAPVLKEKIIVTQGFIGSTAEGHPTTLGREGSDFTAAIYAYCLDAESVTVWKDVPGILNADPRTAKETKKYDRLSYTDAVEMTYYGAQVIHPKTIKPLAIKNITMYVRSFITPEGKGTEIIADRKEDLFPALIRKNNQCLFSFAGKDFSFVNENSLSTIFRALAHLNIKINMMQNSAISFSVCVDNNKRKLTELKELLESEFTITSQDNLDLVTVKYCGNASEKEYSEGRKIVLEQKTGDTLQLVLE